MLEGDCDYCPGVVSGDTYRCSECGYDYTALVESGEYSFEYDLDVASFTPVWFDAEGREL